jgi:hypothetical protein
MRVSHRFQRRTVRPNSSLRQAFPPLSQGKPNNLVGFDFGFLCHANAFSGIPLVSFNQVHSTGERCRIFLVPKGSFSPSLKSLPNDFCRSATTVRNAATIEDPLRQHLPRQDCVIKRRRFYFVRKT